MEYASSFELSPPAWVDELVLPNQQEEPAAVLSSTVLFPPVIDAQVVKQTEQMTRAIQRKRQLRVDFSRVTSIDMIGADLLPCSKNRFDSGSRFERPRRSAVSGKGSAGSSAVRCTGGG